VWKQRRQQAEEDCRKWNEAYPIGTPVLFTPDVGFRGTRIEWTRTNAIVFARAWPMCWITGWAGAKYLTQLRPRLGATRPQLRMPLEASWRAFRMMLHVNPLVACHYLAVECLHGGWLDAYAPDFAVRFLHVLEREHNLGLVLQPEAVQQISHVFRRHDALNVILSVRLNAEFSLQFVGRNEPPRPGYWRSLAMRCFFVCCFLCHVLAPLRSIILAI
jgi:hypothetical protein